MSICRIFPLFVVAFVATSALHAQDEMIAVQEPRPVRFDPLVRVMDYNKSTGMVSVYPAGATTPEQAQTFKGYPYGTVMEVGEGVRCKFFFKDTTYMVVRGPARFTPKQTNDWNNVNLAVDYGEINLFVERQVEPNQFTITTPLGTFEDVRGLCKLRIAKLSEIHPHYVNDDFYFLAQVGSARFVGHNIATQPLANSTAFYIEGGTEAATTLVGAAGEVKLDLPAGNGNTTPFSLTPGARAKITREKPAGSKNWVVSVLTLYANGQAQDYFCYVENREGNAFATGQILSQMLAPEESDEAKDAEKDSAAAPEESYDEEMSDFGDDASGLDGLDDLDLGDGGFLE